MKLSDPFPLPGLGLSPTQHIQWDRIARKIVHDTLQLQRGERVILQANPYYHGAIVEQIRHEIQVAGAIELATLLDWTEAPGSLRTAKELARANRDAAAEHEAKRALFRLADVYIWLPHDSRGSWPTHTVGEIEKILDSWPGRAVHFHWFHDPLNLDPQSPANRALDLVYQSAILDLDYGALRRSMERLQETIAGRRVRVTTPAGTSLSFHAGKTVNLNYGDASRNRVSALPTYGARAREEEMPCGAIRAIPLTDSVEGVIVLPPKNEQPTSVSDYTLPSGLFDEGAELHFRRGRVTRLRSQGDQKTLEQSWSSYSGDKDRLGEFVLGMNPLLRPVPGSAFPPYFGYGEGILRLAIGDNSESGGAFRSNLFAWLLFGDASIAVDDRQIVQAGRLAQEFAVRG